MHRLREEEYGGAGQVLNKSRLFEHGGDARQSEITWAALTITEDKEKGWAQTDGSRCHSR